MDPNLRTAVQLIIGDRDDATRRRDDPARHSTLRDFASGETWAYNMALATIAGAEGFGHRADLELAAQVAPPLPTARLQAEDIGDQAVTDHYRQAELDTQDAQMGGWEPRS